jgi:transcriptional regulator with XRE-family HTH domain
MDTDADDNLALGRALAALRRQAGKKQADAAKAVGIGETFLSQVERGHRSPSWRTTFALLELYDTTLTQFATEFERGSTG